MAQDRPNILVFLTDDHGQWALPAYGAEEIEAPNLDYLARHGARMANAFTPCPVCSPARASFWTGRYPSGHGIHDYLKEERSSDHPGLLGQPTLGLSLAQAGYTVGLSGKWHCHHDGQKPQGFDYWFTSSQGTTARFTQQRFHDGAGIVEVYGHQAPVYTDRAIQFLRQRDQGRPFFLFVGYTDTHTPHTGAPPRLVDRYRDCGFPSIPPEQDNGIHGRVRVPRPADEATVREQNAQYYASVTMIDDQVGRIIDELESRKQLDNTVIVYTADHGHMNGHHGLWCKGNTTVPQNFIEESIRVPCLLWWPGRIGAGRVLPQFVDHCDLHATLLEIAGARLAEAASTVASPGRSYLPLLCGHAMDDWRDAQFGDYGNARMIRTSRHKLIRRYPGPNGHHPDELYDLLDDPREMRNVLGERRYADVSMDLARRVDEFFSRYEHPRRAGRRIAQIPTHNEVEPWRYVWPA